MFTLPLLFLCTAKHTLRAEQKLNNPTDTKQVQVIHLFADTAHETSQAQLSNNILVTTKSATIKPQTSSIFLLWGVRQLGGGVTAGLEISVTAEQCLRTMP